MSEPHPIADSSKIWLSTLAIPVYAAILSFLFLLLQGIASLFSAWHSMPEHNEAEAAASGASTTLTARFRRHVQSLGGWVILAWRVSRFLTLGALLGLQIFTALLFHKHAAKHGHGHTGFPLLQLGLAVVYAYAILLAWASFVAKASVARTAARHVSLVLLVAWSVFFYRDLWPLLTYTLRPIDAPEGWLIWTKVGLLTWAATVVPLLVPREYIPVDPEDPAEEVNPEQTACILSMALYLFLDPIIWKAYRVPHLPYDDLFPLADYDYTKNLVNKSFRFLDPFQTRSKRHIFFGLMRTFWREYIVLGIMLVTRVITTFAIPIGIYNLLDYLSDPSRASVRPGVWIAWLALGPILGSVAVQWYIFVATRILVQVQAIITQLVFDHALRIRVKAETTGSTPVSSAAVTPDTASIAESAPGDGDGASEADTTTAVSEGTAPKHKRSASDADSTATKVPEKDEKDKDTKGGNLVGKLNNLVTTDLNNVVDGRDFLFMIIYMPVQIFLCIWFLYEILGWSAFMGMLVIVVMIPLPGYVAKLIQGVQATKMKKTDARVQNVTESMNVIRMIKLFGWEPKVNDQVADKREDELSYIRKFKMLELANGLINFSIPVLTMIVTYMTYTVVMKKELTASRVFSSMAVFDILQENLHGIFGFLPMVIQAKVSLDRVSEFMTTTELLDQYANELEEAEAPSFVPQVEIDPTVIGIRESAFTWSRDNDGTATPGRTRRSWALRIEEEVTFKRGAINLIVGPTGSGKTSMLMALLGEMHYLPAGPEAYVALPRAGGVAYAAQESWVQNETIRDNILFGAPYDEERYNKVIEQCALKRDLTLFDAGDKTEVGEKGLTLSGGQKARITLARAVYSSAEILLLDDVLAALDVHTSKWIVEKCFMGDLIRGRTVLLVTHNVHITRPIADFVVSLGTDGRIKSQGSLSSALAKDKKLAKELAEGAEETDKAEHTVDQSDPVAENAAPKSDGKLIVAEELQEGHVGWSALKLYFVALGGDSQFIFWSLFLGGMTLCRLLQTAQAWYLGYWAKQYEIHDPSEVDVGLYLTGYSLMLVVVLTCYTIGYVIFVYGALRASRTIHRDLVTSVLGTTLRWLDKTPTSRIITRCTQDIQAIDGPIAEYFGWLVDMTIGMFIKFVSVIVISPTFLLPGMVISVLGAWCGQIYIKAQLAVKREMSNARAPVLGHFGAAVAGLTSIRAYGAQEAFKQESYKRIDKFSRAARMFYNLNRWVCIRIEMLAGFFSAGLAAYLVYWGGVSASDTGFALTMAVGFSGMILWWVRTLNEFEVSGNSLERIQQYMVIEQEPKATPEGVPPAYWPTTGELVVNNLAAKYSVDGPKVLKDVSFHIKSGERVGIVGRTGSGKSSLTLALLRCILTEGEVLYDGIATDKINLDILRSNITIIPQAPELLSGTLRQNLDPFDQHDDAVLNDALRAAGLFSLQDETDEGRITLDSQISSGGSNLSVGQRQILVLARAIVRQSKLLILDEATSAIDYETDTVIQASLRQRLDKDVTLLTVAHRLQTIMDADKIMVLDAGRIVEFGKPSELLKIEGGMLKALVDESGEKAHLYAMADGTA
ncbi:multidrug resistance-associated ABC transporter [Phanerochaete sordida]|uniref:Multidrug resistance-associated ABC transporter n=1 Tax=Phanerochaete sordida TaxID=48140 RepID=A0A9P3FZ53_9APHY|nr:multidrug resistance-associated ABC transporter [Phanerochaete sordida]